MITTERLHEMATALMGVDGVYAVALGGSRARGTHHEGSDVDLGLYYEATELDLPGLSAATSRFSDHGSVDIAGPGAWGPWVDGGGWLTVDGIAVDWILRDLSRVREQCDRARRGDFLFHAQPGHPLGFLDITYAGEVATCLPLADPSGHLASLKNFVDPYPPALRKAMIENIWQAEFHANAATKGVAKRDIGYVLLCCVSALMTCAHAWHAAAGQWTTNEKGLIVDVAALQIDSSEFSRQAATALTCPTNDTESLEGVVAATRDLIALTVDSVSS